MVAGTSLVDEDGRSELAVVHGDRVGARSRCEQSGCCGECGDPFGSDEGSVGRAGNILDSFLEGRFCGSETLQGEVRHARLTSLMLCRLPGCGMGPFLRIGHPRRDRETSFARVP